MWGNGIRGPRLPRDVWAWRAWWHSSALTVAGPGRGGSHGSSGSSGLPRWEPLGPLLSAEGEGQRSSHKSTVASRRQAPSLEGHVWVSGG